MALLKLIKNARLYGEGELTDLLIGGKTLLTVGTHLGLTGVDVEVNDVEGRSVIPGLVDQHVHLIGAPGDEGLASQTPEIFVEHFVSAGVTTAVGCLGFGRVTDNLRALYVKALCLDEQGITTYVYTGAFAVPSPTITGHIGEDIVIMQKVLGVKVAICDAYSSQPSIQELARIASEAYVAGLQAGKPGLVHVHVGHHGDPYQMLAEVQRVSGVPIAQFVPTHCNWSRSLVNGAKEYALNGGFVDFSTVLDPARGSITSVRASEAVMELVHGGVALDRITLSCDGNVGMPLRLADGTKIGLYLERVGSLWSELRCLALEGLGLRRAVALGSENPARRLKLYPQKGSLVPGADADIIVLNDDLTIHSTYARGVLAYADGKCVLKSQFGEEGCRRE